MTRSLLILLAAPGLALAQSSANFRLEAASSLPTAQTTSSESFLLTGSLGNTFSQVTTSTCLEVAAGIIPHRLPSDLEGPFIDLDRDGLADGWEVFFFGNTAADPSTDSDGDGESNASEQLAATNPLLFASIFRLIGVDHAGTKVGLVWTGAINKPYEIEYSPDLGLTPWLTIGTATSNSVGTGTFNDTNPARINLPVGFYRVVLLRD